MYICWLLRWDNWRMPGHAKVQPTKGFRLPDELLLSFLQSISRQMIKKSPTLDEMLVENEAIKWIFIMCWQEHIVCFLKLATCGNIRPHILQIKLCRVHCGPISDEICGQIRFSGKNLDTKIISGLGGQKMPLTFTLHPICIEEEEGQKNSNLKVGKMSFLANCFPVCFKVFTFGFLWISCELSSIALQVSRGLIAVLVACNCGNLPLRAKRNLKTHMSAKHGRHGENCDPSEHKSRRPAPVLSTIDISASSTKIADLTEKL